MEQTQMTRDDVREKVARAIEPLLWHPQAQALYEPGELALMQANARLKADAAIGALLDAIREPSEGMIEAARGYDAGELTGGQSPTYTGVWCAMIDALRADLSPPSA